MQVTIATAVITTEELCDKIASGHGSTTTMKPAAALRSLVTRLGWLKDAMLTGDDDQYINTRRGAVAVSATLITSCQMNWPRTYLTNKMQKDMHKDRIDGQLEPDDDCLDRIWEGRLSEWVQGLARFCEAEISLKLMGHCEGGNQDLTPAWMTVCVQQLREWVGNIDAAVLAKIKDLAYKTQRPACDRRKRP